MFCIYPNGSEANEMIVGVNDVIPPGEWERKWSSGTVINHATENSLLS